MKLLGKETLARLKRIEEQSRNGLQQVEQLLNQNNKAEVISDFASDHDSDDEVFKTKEQVYKSVF
jgi:hypothetical protein